jgi:hypothetical protein
MNRSMIREARVRIPARAHRAARLAAMAALATLFVLAGCADDGRSSVEAAEAEARAAAEAAAADAASGNDADLIAAADAASAAVDAAAEAADGEGPAQAAFSTQDCYQQHFPLALQLPASGVPGEIKLYCHTAWDFEALHGMRAALEESGFDLIEAYVRSVPEARQGELRTAMTFAQQQAATGPHGLPDIWYLYQVGPALAALHRGNPDADVVRKQFVEQDVQRMEAAAAKIDWHRPMERTDPATARKLEDFGKVVLANAR